MAPAYQQDLPPEGGYLPFNWKRIPARTIFKGWQLFGIFTAVTSVSLYLYTFSRKEAQQAKLENNDASIALQPIFWAERERELLRQFRRNRDEEAELMKNVPGWKVGTYYGEPIFKTLPKDDWFLPALEELFAHTHPDKQEEKQLLCLRQ